MTCYNFNNHVRIVGNSKGELSNPNSAHFKNRGRKKEERMEKVSCVKLKIIKEGSSAEMSVSSCYDVYRIMKFVEKKDRENFYAVHLDTKNRVLAIECISIGTLQHSLMHPREIFKGAILNNSAAIILVHNHPSGDPSPSPEDLQITERLSRAGDLLGINVYDHMVIGNGNYRSIKFEPYMYKKPETKKINKINETIDPKVAEISERIKEIKGLIEAYPETKPLMIELLQTKTIMETTLESLFDSVISFLKQSVTRPKKYLKVVRKGGSHESAGSN
jgi:DNA repair protein RadC